MSSVAVTENGHCHRRRLLIGIFVSLLLHGLWWATLRFSSTASLEGTKKQASVVVQVDLRPVLREGTKTNGRQRSQGQRQIS